MRWRRARPSDGASLIGRFALLSFLVIGATTVALSSVISSSLRRDMLAREWHVTAGYIHREAQQWLGPEDFANPATPHAREHFRRFYAEMMRVPETIRVKLYDRTMTIVWSDEPRLIGQRFADNPELVEAV